MHTASFAVYNALIGYLLLHREDPGPGPLVLFAFAMGVHFVVNDYGLRHDHKGAYDRVAAGSWRPRSSRVGRWGSLSRSRRPPSRCSSPFWLGGVIMNVLKEELPEERESRFWAFALGAALYAVVLLVAF